MHVAQMLVQFLSSQECFWTDETFVLFWGGFCLFLMRFVMSIHIVSEMIFWKSLKNGLIFFVQILWIQILYLCANFWPHIGQAKGFSPVCVLMCLAICDVERNSESQIVHFFGRWFTWIFLCILNDAEWINCLPHTSHWNNCKKL